MLAVLSAQIRVDVENTRRSVGADLLAKTKVQAHVQKRVGFAKLCKKILFRVFGNLFNRCVVLWVSGDHLRNAGFQGG